MKCPHCNIDLDIAEAGFKGIDSEGYQLDDTIGHCFCCHRDYKWTSKFMLTLILDEYDLEEIYH